MAKSRAKKLRDKLSRQGDRNPELSRGIWNGILPVTKVSPTKQEQVMKALSKHRKRNHASSQGDYGSVLLFA